MSVPASECCAVLLDDHEVIRHGVSLYLETVQDILLLGDVGTSPELFALLEKAPVNVLITDFELGPGDVSGSSLIRQVRRRHPDCCVLVLSGYSEVEQLAMAEGAHAFMHKARSLQDLTQVIRYLASQGAKGQRIDREISWDLPQAREIAGATRIDHPGLTAREREVLQRWLQGQTVSDIAQALGTHRNTISTQKRAAMRKLSIANDNALRLAQWLQGSERIPSFGGASAPLA